MALVKKTGTERDRRRGWLSSGLFGLALPAALAFAAAGPAAVRADDDGRGPRDGERREAEHGPRRDGEHRDGKEGPPHKPGKPKPGKPKHHEDRHHEDRPGAVDGDGPPHDGPHPPHDGPGRGGPPHPDKVIGDVNVDVSVDVGINVIVNSSNIAVGPGHGTPGPKPAQPHDPADLDHDRPAAHPRDRGPVPEQRIHELEESVRRLRDELEQARRPRGPEGPRREDSQGPPREMQDRLEQMRREMQRHAEETQERFRRQMEERRNHGGDGSRDEDRRDGGRRDGEPRRDEDEDERRDREDGHERDRAESGSRLPRFQAFFDSLQNFDF